MAGEPVRAELFGAEAAADVRCRFTPLDLAAKLIAPPEPVPWIAEGYLARGDAAVLAGHAGVGKTIVALDLGLAAATSGKWLDAIRVPGPLRVAIFDEEQHERLVLHRLRLQGAGRGLSAAQVGALPLHYYSQISLDLSDDDQLYGFKEAIQDGGYDLVIIDSLTRVCGRLDMNDAKDSATFFGTAILPLCRDLNVSIVLLHHSRKPNGREHDGSRQLGVRGSGDIPAAVSEVLVIEREAAGEARTLYQTKCRWQPEQPPRGVAFEGGTKEGALRVLSCAAASDVDAFVIDQLGQAGAEGLPRTDLVAAVERGLHLSSDLAKRTASRALKALKESHRVYSQKEGKRVRYWARDFAPAEVLAAQAVLDGKNSNAEDDE